MFRKRLESLMKAKGFNQTSLAKAAKCSSTTVWGIFNRESEPRRDTLDKIAKALGISTAELLRDDAQEPAFDAALMAAILAEILRQLSAARKFPPAQPDNIADQIIALYQSLAERQSAGQTASPRDIANGARIIALGTRG